MKTITKLTLVGLLGVSVSALGACNNGKAYKETRTEEEVVNALGQQAMAELGVSFAKYAAEGITPDEDTKLMTTVNQKLWDGDEVGLNYSVKYSLAALEEYQKEYITLNEAGDTLSVKYMQDSELANYEMAQTLKGAAYSLSATVSFAGYGEGFKAPKGLKPTEEQVGKQIVKKSYNVLDKAVKIFTITEAKENAASGDTVLLYGRVSAAYDWSFSAIFRGVVVTDGNDGALLYAGSTQADFFDIDADGNQVGEAKIKLNDIVSVYGTVSPYNGLFEIKPQKVKVVTDETVKAQVAPTAFRQETIANLITTTQKDTGALAELKGVTLFTNAVTISKLKTGVHWGEKDENKIFFKDAEGNKILFYVNYHVGEAQQQAIKDFLVGLQKGEEFNVKFMITQYNGPQISPMAIGENSVSQCLSK